MFGSGFALHFQFSTKLFGILVQTLTRFLQCGFATFNEDSVLFFIPLQGLRALIEAQHQIALKILYALCEVLAQRLRETNERYMSIFTIAQWGGASPDGPLPLP